MQITSPVTPWSSGTCYSDHVVVELLIDPSASGAAEPWQKTTTVMLWSINEDPQVLDAQAFSNAADLRAWLKHMGATYGAENIVVRWTRELRGATHLARLVAVCLGVALPEEVRQRALTAP